MTKNKWYVSGLLFATFLKVVIPVRPHVPFNSVAAGWVHRFLQAAIKGATVAVILIVDKKMTGKTVGAPAFPHVFPVIISPLTHQFIIPVLMSTGKSAVRKVD